MDFETGRRPEGSQGTPRSSGSGGGRESGSGSAPLRSDRAGGGDFDYRGDPVQSFVRTARGILFGPAAFFGGISRQGDWIGSIIFALVCYEIFAVIGGVIGLIFGSVSSIGAGGAGEQAAGIATSIGGFVAAVILAPAIAAVILFVMAGIRHLLIILIVGAENAGFEATRRVQAYTFATRLFWWIPILGTVVGFIYGLVLSVVGLREVHGTTTGKAALVVLIPVAVLLLLLAILALLLGAAIFTILQQQV